MTTPAASSRFEIREINEKSPHFRLLSCWALWDLRHNKYVRRPGAGGEIRRFYNLGAARAHKGFMESESE